VRNGRLRKLTNIKFYKVIGLECELAFETSKDLKSYISRGIGVLLFKVKSCKFDGIVIL